MAQGDISLLSMTAANAEDPQTLQMVAGAISNLCGNDKLQTKLRGEGGIKALLGMVRCRHPDVHAQVARGIANFAKCESRASSQGTFYRTLQDSAQLISRKHTNNAVAGLQQKYTKKWWCATLWPFNLDCWL